MTRGTLFYYESDNKVWSSTVFNGDMYHGTPAEPQGYGDDVIKLMQKISNVDDFKEILVEINKNYGYDEGNDCYSVGKAAITKDIKATIKCIDEERRDLKGSSMDPRTWEEKPSFKDVRTWQFWGTPNLSDYSYIYNNSGEDLVMITRDNGEEMIIPDGCCGVLNYGSKDLGCFTVEVTLREDGKYDAFIAHEGSSGSKYQGITVDEIGRMVADDIESVAKCS